MNVAEAALCSHLTTMESLDVLVAEGFLNEASLEVIPTEFIRFMVHWCLDYYFKNGRKLAPTKTAIMETLGEFMESLDIVIEDEVDGESVEWAIDQLRSEHARWRSEQLLKQIAQSVATATPDQRVAAVQDAAHQFYLLSQSLISRRNEAVLGLGIEDALQRYRADQLSGVVRDGLTFGLPEIDDYTLGIHPGELAIFAAFSGVGKSWVAAKTVLAEFEEKRRTVLFTLENSLPMTMDRLACMSARVDYGLWQQRQVEEVDLARVEEWQKIFQDADHAPIIISPEEGERDPASMVRKALVLGAQSVIIDQLSHVGRVPGTKARERNQQVAEIVRTLSQEVQGREPLPCLLLHQIKRDGQKAARQTGHYVMDDLAESAEVERSASWVFAVYQSTVMEATERAQWQTLKTRRGRPKDWEMNWRLAVGDIRVLREAVPQ